MENQNENNKDYNKNNKNKDKNDILRRLLSEAIQTKEQINEDDFLTEEDKEKKIVIKDKDKPRRACVNCTCGRAEKKIVKKSSCGNCYKGDLFRYEGCPSYGLPAYEPGDVVSFDDDDYEMLEGFIGCILERNVMEIKA